MSTLINVNQTNPAPKTIRSADIPCNQFFFSTGPESTNVLYIAPFGPKGRTELYVRGGGSYSTFIMSVNQPDHHWTNLSDLQWGDYSPVSEVSITTK